MLIWTSRKIASARWSCWSARCSGPRAASGVWSRSRVAAVSMDSAARGRISAIRWNAVSAVTCRATIRWASVRVWSRSRSWDRASVFRFSRYSAVEYSALSRTRLNVPAMIWRWSSERSPSGASPCPCCIGIPRLSAAL